MKKLTSKSQKFIEWIIGHPHAKVAPVARKFGISPALGYRLRNKARGHQIGIYPPYVEEEALAPLPVLVDDTLKDRAKDYGIFKDGAALMQALKRTVAEHAAKHDKTFADDQWEALEMIMHKMGRIVNGNPDVVDHWVDIAGYATLVADRLQGNAR